MSSPNWAVTAYAESQGPGDEVTLGTVNVPVGGPPFSLDEAYTATLTVPTTRCPEENPGDPTQSGTYKIVVTAFLDSTLGQAGYDMMGYAEGRNQGRRAPLDHPPDRPARVSPSGRADQSPPVMPLPPRYRHAAWPRRDGPVTPIDNRHRGRDLPDDDPSQTPHPCKRTVPPRRLGLADHLVKRIWRRTWCH